MKQTQWTTDDKINLFGWLVVGPTLLILFGPFIPLAWGIGKVKELI